MNRHLHWLKFCRLRGDRIMFESLYPHDNPEPLQSPDVCLELIKTLVVFQNKDFVGRVITDISEAYFGDLDAVILWHLYDLTQWPIITKILNTKFNISEQEFNQDRPFIALEPKTITAENQDVTCIYQVEFDCPTCTQTVMVTLRRHVLLSENRACPHCFQRISFGYNSILKKLGELGADKLTQLPFKSFEEERAQWIPDHASRQLFGQNYNALIYQMVLDQLS